MTNVLNINTFKNIHGKDMLLVNNYQFMFYKNLLRKREENNVYLINRNLLKNIDISYNI